MRIIGVYEKSNNTSKRKANQDSKCGKFHCLYYYDDQNRFHTKKVSRLEAIKIKLFTQKEQKTLMCDYCGLIQYENKNGVCVNCQE